jgi:hypothetical protein
MRSALWIVMLSALASGCSLVGDATRTVVQETRLYLDTRAEEARNRRWAEQAWEEVRTSSGPAIYSDDYADGFKAGFADHLFAGGSGEPPPLPPRRYWARRYETPDGYTAIQDWFTGFRQGAAAARDGGYRRWVTVPSPLHQLPGPGGVPEPALQLPSIQPPVSPAPGPSVQAELVWPVHWSLTLPPGGTQEAGPSAAPGTGGMP